MSAQCRESKVTIECTAQVVEHVLLGRAVCVFVCVLGMLDVWFGFC